MRRHSNLLAWIAALGLLLHAGTAAASIWCSMTGLGTACCCPKEDPPSDDLLHGEPSDCCRQALDAQAVDAGSFAAPMVPVLVTLPWDEIRRSPASPEGWADEASPSATSPPLLALASIVILR